MANKREMWVIKELKSRTRSQVEASYRGFVEVTGVWSAMSKVEVNHLNSLRRVFIDLKKSNKTQIIRAINAMWEISERYWKKYIENDDNGYDKYEALHMINHDFLVILNPEAYDIDEYLELGIISKRMFDYKKYIKKQKLAEISEKKAKKRKRKKKK